MRVRNMAFVSKSETPAYMANKYIWIDKVAIQTDGRSIKRISHNNDSGRFFSRPMATIARANNMYEMMTCMAWKPTRLMGSEMLCSNQKFMAGTARME